MRLSWCGLPAPARQKKIVFFSRASCSFEKMPLLIPKERNPRAILTITDRRSLTKIVVSCCGQKANALFLSGNTTRGCEMMVTG
jgi:hypothetical protein